MLENQISKSKRLQTGIRVVVDSTAARLRENAVEQSTRHSTTKTGGQSCAKAQGRWKTLRVGGAWQLHRFQGGLADGPFAGWPGRVGAPLAASCVASCCCFTLLHVASCRFTLLCARRRRQNADLGTETHASGNYVVLPFAAAATVCCIGDVGDSVSGHWTDRLVLDLYTPPPPRFRFMSDLML